MSLKRVLESNKKTRKNGLIIEADIGWLGPKPAKTKAEKLHQIKTEFIDERGLLVEGAKSSDFSEYTHISADISVHDLIECVGKLTKKKDFLVIDGLDGVSETEQEKFIPLLKDRQILSSKLPDEVQILIPVNEVKKVSNDVKSLTFRLDV